MNLNIAPNDHPALRTIAVPIKKVSVKYVSLGKQMMEVMESLGGIGISAPQVGLSVRLIVVWLREKGTDPLFMVNPEYVRKSSKKIKSIEGCLSFPGIAVEIQRHEEVVVRYRDHNNRSKHVTTKGLLATAIQHEIDHLNGVLFTDKGIIVQQLEPSQNPSK